MRSSTLPLGTIYFEQYSLKFRRFKNLIWNLSVTLAYGQRRPLMLCQCKRCFVGVGGTLRRCDFCDLLSTTFCFICVDHSTGMKTLQKQLSSKFQSVDLTFVENIRKYSRAEKRSTTMHASVHDVTFYLLFSLFETKLLLKSNSLA